MMNHKIFAQYQFKYYLNGSHYIFIDGRKGQSHPHTWEFVLTVLIYKENFLEFNVFEKEIEKYFSAYQGKTLNEVEPFDTVMPTLENMVDYYGEQLREQLRNIGGELIRIEGSETPTRSYVISFERDSVFMTNLAHYTSDSVDRIFDNLIKNVEQ